ncbi:linear amide C-N hydrolase [Variovorax sp. M-6]|uniref:linear amide C-N hydrolase n=1 Tax=Variovorax sp. M-6 TaxID=3233041 RepID=UPI003F982E1F
MTALAVAAALVVPDVALACTSFLVRTTDGGAVYGRTMEFAFPLQSSAIVVPRQYAMAATGPEGKPGMAWKSRYAVVGVNALGITTVIDGMNEKGLAGGALYFPGFAGYADPAKTHPAKSLAPWDFIGWALTSFATVAEVKAALSGILIVDVKQPNLGIVPPLHYTLHDASGASIVVEPVDGVLKVYDNPLGVMTNSPPFDWHMTNLRNYVKLSAANAPDLKLEGQTITPLGQGSGMLGIPGDPTPPSRFVRALGYTLSAQRRQGGIESVRLTEHILNNFDIPIGWIKEGSGNETSKVPLEYTQWSTIADLSNRKFYVKTYDDPTLRSIDLMSFDLNAKSLTTAAFKPAAAPQALEFQKP